MLVSELIKRLQEYPDDTPVHFTVYDRYETPEPEEVYDLATHEMYLYNEVQEEYLLTKVVVIK